MNYPKKEEYNVVKRLKRKERNTIGSLEEFLDFRFKYDPPSKLKYSKFFIPLFKYYNIVNLNNSSFVYGYLYFSHFISHHRKEILELKQAINIEDFYLYKYQDTYGQCCDDMAGLLFKNKQEKMIFLLKHAEIIDTMNRE